MRSVLVTGAAGFLGRAVCRRFALEGWTVSGLGSAGDRPPGCQAYHRMALPDSRCGVLIASLQPAVIVHCAGRASVPESFHDPGRDFAASAGVVFALLDEVRLHSPGSKLLLLSSAAVYGDPRRLPIDEAHEPSPVSPYGFHKRICEELAAEFTRCFGLRTAIARIFSAYGPGLRRQVVWDLCERVIADGPLLLQGTGAETRDFIHADDVAAALFLIATRADCGGEAYNLASGEETSIADVAAAVVERLAPGTPVRFSGVLPPGVPSRWRADVTRLKTLGFHPERDLQRGLAETLDWNRRELATRCLKKSA